jgi:hypothetical protein
MIEKIVDAVVVVYFIYVSFVFILRDSLFGAYLGFQTAKELRQSVSGIIECFDHFPSDYVTLQRFQPLS